MQFPLPFAPVGLLSPIRFAIARSWPQLIRRREQQPMFWTVITRFFPLLSGIFFPSQFVPIQQAGQPASQQASKQASAPRDFRRQASQKASKQGRQEARKQASQSVSKASQRCFSHLTATSKSLRSIVSKLFICIQTISDINC